MPVCRACSVIRGTNQNSGEGLAVDKLAISRCNSAVLDGLTTTKRAMLVRETLVIHSRLSWRKERGEAAIKRQHGLQTLAIEQLAARLAGGFLQPINSDALKEAIGEAIAIDLGEFNEIKTLPGFPRAAATTLEKAWAAGLKFAELGSSTDAVVRSRIDAVSRTRGACP